MRNLSEGIYQQRQATLVIQVVLWSAMGAVFGLVAQVLAAHVLSDCGVINTKTLQHGCPDGIQRFGFPFIFLEQGGLIGRSEFKGWALLIDAFLTFICALLLGVSLSHVSAYWSSHQDRAARTT